MPRVFVVLALCAGVLTACTAQPGGAEPPPLTAEVVVHGGTASITDAAGDAAEADAPLVAGDTVAAAGEDALVELRWSDGAVTRLGAGTAFTIGGLDPADDARGVQEGGVTWNREARSDSENARPYGVRVAGDLVAERGSFFIADCRSGTCRIAATGGEGGDGSRTTFRRLGTADVVTSDRLAAWGEIFGDPWAVRNAELDAEAGFPPVADAFKDADPARAALTGDFDGVIVSRSKTCTGGGCGYYGFNKPGGTVTRRFTFQSDCSQGIPCLPTVTTAYFELGTGAAKERTVPLHFDGTTYTWGFSDRIPLCIWTYGDGSKAETGAGQNTLTWSATPGEAAIVDGAFVVSELSGTFDGSTTIIERTNRKKFPGCDYWEVEWASESAIAFTRADG